MEPLQNSRLQPRAASVYLRADTPGTRILLSRRQGFDLKKAAIPATPKKKYRGWGPKVQFGKRVR